MGRFQQVPGFGNPPQPPQPRYAPRFSTYELPKLEAMEARAGACIEKMPKMGGISHGSYGKMHMNVAHL